MQYISLKSLDIWSDMRTADDQILTGYAFALQEIDSRFGAILGRRYAFEGCPLLDRVQHLL